MESEGSEVSSKQHGPTPTRIYIFVIACIVVLITGCINLTALSAAARTISPPCTDCEPTAFKSAFTFQFAHMTAQSFCLILHFLDRGISRCWTQAPPHLEFQSVITNSAVDTIDVLGSRGLTDMRIKSEQVPFRVVSLALQPIRETSALPASPPLSTDHSNQTESALSHSTHERRVSSRLQADHKAWQVVSEFKSAMNGRSSLPAKVHKEIPPKWIWVLPAIMDFCEAMFTFWADQVLSAVVVQSVKTANVIMTAAFCSCMLGNHLRVYHWFALTVLTVGCGLIGADGEKTDTDDKIHIGGLCLVLLGTCFTAFLLIYQEVVFRLYKCAPFQAIGWIGLFETILSMTAFGIAHGVGHDNIVEVAYQLRNSKRLVSLLAGFTVSVVFFSIACICTTKLGGAIVTVILMSLRVVPLWLVHLWLGWVPFKIGPLIGVFLVCISFVLHTGLLKRCATPLMDKTGWRWPLKYWVCDCQCYAADVHSDSETTLSSLDLPSDQSNQSEWIYVEQEVCVSVSDEASVSSQGKKLMGVLI
eukprot:Blabericola_migrator_1__4229@NODE_229_length_11083_cov_77_301198_g195_i0_p3_GENE_NODE_229_length_11083_cov_77_301198_g195_i0NODE_229_length_11083_cov_77_301198_g195_i0_p3_ORF_typecomplete_len531_score59_03Nuc_sug_transp/PF04142_15/5_1e19SLC35F/PF06027_12/2_3e18CRTlike/PF08627_10/1e04CRTlike/PF08627_10/2e18UAA/PF08449_11/1_6e03UAA/PF08449_11/7e16TPT/PF03151_16/6_1e03TPT/PF03151_16/1_7e03TPT/PF03151_16/1_6e09PUNUT/PF16913_5/5_8e03PUNUT/PF16913_5/1_6e08Mg_trans_NIPA/PF05653_14/2e02Mg_trans_NIPA/PF0